MASAALFGRSEQLAALHAAAARAREGVAQLVTIRGEAGIGKSTLLDGAVEDLVGSGTTVVRVALSSVESQLGWAGLRLLYDSLGGEAGRLPDALRSAIPAAIGRTAAVEVDPGQVAFALSELLVDATDRAALALVVDDLHWLDGATAAALAFAIRATARRPVLTVLAHRPVELPFDPGKLVDPACRTAIDLDGLSVAGVHRLLRERAGLRLGRPDAIRIHEASGGSPLHTIEIGRLLATGVALDDALVHPSAYDVLLTRVRRLPDDTRQVLLAAALAARSAAVHVRAALPDVDVDAALEVAAAQGLADLRAGVIEFGHPLARAAVVAGATGTARRTAQRALANVVDDPDERLLLLQAATDRPDTTLAAELHAASARASDRGDLVLAARFVRWAAERTPADDLGARVERLLCAAELAAASGELQAPVDLADAALALSPDLDVCFRAGVVKALTIGNRGEEGRCVELLEQLLEQLAGRPAQCARLHDIRAQALMREDVPRSLDAARASLDEATSFGDANGIDRARSLVDFLSVLAGEPIDADEVARRCERLSLAGVARDWCVSALSAWGLASVSLRHNVLQLAEYERLGLVHYEAPTRSRMVADLIALGHYRRALEQVDACLDLQEMVGGLYVSPLRADVAFLAAMFGDEDRADDARTAAARLVLDSADNIDSVGAMARLAQLDVVRGAWADAAEWAARAAAASSRVGLDSSTVFAFRIDGVEALVQLGRLDEAECLLAELESINTRSRHPRGTADSARGRALLAAARGDLDAAVELGRAAADAYRDLELPLEAARALQFTGATLRRAGKRSGAADCLSEARREYERLEAPTLIARVEAELERLGAKRPGAATTLTPTEQQIADLVVAGKSNAEIAAKLMVSVRTVESNLTRVYRKVGVRSRTELAASMRDR